MVYTAVGAILGSSLMTTLPAYADSGFKEFWGKMFQNGQYVQQAPAIAYNGTSYFGIWYIQHLLQQDGITATWNGQSLQLSSVPVQRSTTLSTTANGTSTGTTAPVNSINVDGVTYVPLASVQALLQQSGAGIGLKSPEDGGDGSDSAAQGPSLRAPIEQIKGALDKLQSFGEDGGKGHGEDAHASFEQFFSAIAKLQTAVVELQAVSNAGAAMNGTTTSTPTTTGTTTTGTTTTPTTTGGTTTTTTPTTTGGSATTTTTTTASVASVTAALQADIASLTQLLNSTTGGVTPTSGTGSSSTTTTTGTTGTTATGSGSTTTTTTTATPATFASIVEDIMMQLATLESMQGPGQGDSHHDDAMARG